MNPMPYDHDRFLHLATTQAIADAPTAACWQLVVDGISCRYLGGLNLDKVIRLLKQQSGCGLNELDFDWTSQEPATITVSLVNESASCSGPALIAELERLGRRYRGEPEPSDPSGQPDAEPVSELGPLLSQLLAAASAPPATRSPEDQRRLSLAHGHLSRLARELQSPEPRVQAAAAAEVARLRTSLGGLQQAVDQRIAPLKSGEVVLGDYDSATLVQTLHRLVDFLEARTTASGQEIDALLAALDRGLGRDLGPGFSPDPAAAEAARDQRIRESARSAIAEGLRKAGIMPSRDKK